MTRWFSEARLNRHPWLMPVYALTGFIGWPFTLLHRHRNH
jgi:hypothetical protein